MNEKGRVAVGVPRQSFCIVLVALVSALAFCLGAAAGVLSRTSRWKWYEMDAPIYVEGNGLLSQVALPRGTIVASDETLRPDENWTVYVPLSMLKGSFWLGRTHEIDRERASRNFLLAQPARAVRETPVEATGANQ